MSRSRTVVLALLLALVAATASAPARADGDPASDVLYTQWVFVPQDASAAASDRAELEALVAGARAAGMPVKVAVVGSSYDLGSVTALWRRPKLYARFLGTELSFVYRGRLIVAMPNGLGVARAGKASAADTRLLAGVKPQASLVATASAAVRALARGHGIELTATGAAAAPSASRQGGNPWRTPVALGLGALAIAAAWGYSLRARPLGGKT